MDSLDDVTLDIFFLDMKNLWDLLVADNLDIGVASAQSSGNSLNLNSSLEISMRYSSIFQQFLV